MITPPPSSTRPDPLLPHTAPLLSCFHGPVPAITIDRLSKLGPQDTLSAFCGDWRCPKHSAGVVLDIPALVARHGDLEIGRLPWLLRCSLCGHRPAEIRLGWSLPE